MFTPRLPPQYTTTLYDADIPYDSDIRYDWVVPILPNWDDRNIPTTNWRYTRLWLEYLLDWNGDQILDWNGESILTIVPWWNIPLNSWSTRPVI